MGILSDLWNGDVWLIDDVKASPIIKTLGTQKDEHFKRIYNSLSEEQKKLMLEYEAAEEEYVSTLYEEIFKKGVGFGSRLMTEIYETNIKILPEKAT